MQADWRRAGSTVPVDPDRMARRPLRTTMQARRQGRSGVRPGGPRWARGTAATAVLPVVVRKEPSVMARSTLAQARLGWPPRGREHLARADLHLAGLSLTPLPGADFRRADLHEAWLRDACLHAADLRDADLEDADLEGADLDAADPRGRTWTAPTFRGRRSRRRRPGRLA
jgi:hypothetical protein